MYEYCGEKFYVNHFGEFKGVGFIRDLWWKPKLKCDAWILLKGECYSWIWETEWGEIWYAEVYLNPEFLL